MYRLKDSDALALAGFVARMGLVDDVDTALATYHLAVRMAFLQRFE
jgi:hypothetical protein